jgi:hypothetical protein
MRPSHKAAAIVCSSASAACIRLSNCDPAAEVCLDTASTGWLRAPIYRRGRSASAAMPATSPCARRRSAGRRYAGLSPMALRRPPIAHITPSSIRPASWACSLASPRRCTCVSQRRALRQDAALDPLLRKLGAGVELLGAPRCAQGDELGGVMSPPAKASCVSRLSADPRAAAGRCLSAHGPMRWACAAGRRPGAWARRPSAGAGAPRNGNGNGNGNGEFRPIDD